MVSGSGRQLPDPPQRLLFRRSGPVEAIAPRVRFFEDGDVVGQDVAADQTGLDGAAIGLPIKTHREERATGA
jgi:hypothetical protein